MCISTIKAKLQKVALGGGFQIRYASHVSDISLMAIFVSLKTYVVATWENPDEPSQ